MSWVVLVWVVVGLALLPAVMFARNVVLFEGARGGTGGVGGEVKGDVEAEVDVEVSVVIPAGDEAVGIAEAVRSVLGSEGVGLEVIVVDDHSRDGTGEIVKGLVEADGRVRLIEAPKLGAGWCGKQHACWVGSKVAKGDLLVFMDADVRLAKDVLVRMAGEIERRGVALISGFPRQVTETWMEKLTLGLIHFLLLGYLPMDGLRRTKKVGFAAGCGQLFMARREGYEAVGGHVAVKGSRHDGLTLPRAFRESGLGTDLFDGSDVAACRMYGSAGEVWRGLGKNATEGMATVWGIVPWTVLLVGGQVLPWVLLLAGVADGWAVWMLVVLALAGMLGVGLRVVMAWRYGLSVWGAFWHPLGVLVVVVIQWWAFFWRLGGREVSWRGRGEAV